MSFDTRKMGVAKIEDVAEQLYALRATGIRQPEALAEITNAANWARNRWIRDRERTRPVDPDSLIGEMRPALFAQYFCTALGWAVGRIVERQQRQNICNPIATQQQLAVQGAFITQQRQELADLQRKSTWAIKGADILTNADLVALVQEFPSVPITDVRRILIDAYTDATRLQPAGYGGYQTRGTISATALLNAARKQLLVRLYGRASDWLNEPVAMDNSGRPLACDWFAVPASFREWLLVRQASHGGTVLGDQSTYVVSELKRGFDIVARRIDAETDGLSWRRHGQTLQTEALAALNVVLEELRDPNWRRRYDREIQERASATKRRSSSPNAINLAAFMRRL